MKFLLIKFYMLVFILFYNINTNAQSDNLEPSNEAEAKNNNLSIEITDNKIISLLNKKTEIDKNTPLQGYRIQIFSGPSRISAYNIQTQFVLKYPAVSNYITYDGANYRLRIGDFLFLQDAEKFKKKIYNQFNITLIVKDTINKPIEYLSAQN